MTISRTSPVTRLVAIAIEAMPAERTTCSDCDGGTSLSSVALGILRSVLFHKMGDRHNAQVVVVQAILLVGRMEAVIR
jgi:hypothetical protein